MMRSIRSTVGELCRDERGLSTVEYVVLLVLIVALAVAAWNSFGSQLQGKLGGASDSFDFNVQAGADGAFADGAGGTTLASKPSQAGTVVRPAEGEAKRKTDKRKTDDPAHSALGGTGHAVAE